MLAACSAPRPAVAPTFRTAGAPIYSSAVMESERLDGTWVQVATFAPGGQAACRPGTADFTAGQLRWDLCLSDGQHHGAGPMIPGKPGRFSVEGMEDWWVLWVDADYRTLVIGTPSGGHGFVLNRDAVLPGDRLVAVRDILKFNGYHIENFVVF
jgi:apolipoprotein D and lipocalin family protein